jgi:hypothetical protein
VLVADLEMQLRLVYRDNLPELTHRNDQLRAALAAWNASAKTDADRQQMRTWLLEGIRGSMPGANRPMPATPVFVEKTNTAANPSSGTSPNNGLLKSPTPAVSAGDPFADDPSAEELPPLKTDNPL